MRIFASPRVQSAVAKTSFDLAKVRSGAPMTIFIVVPPTKLVSHGSLIRLWLATLLGIITERTEPPEQPTIFMVDELAQLGGLRAFKEAATLLRGYGLRCCQFLQSHAQLKSPEISPRSRSETPAPRATSCHACLTRCFISVIRASAW